MCETFASGGVNKFNQLTSEWTQLETLSILCNEPAPECSGNLLSYLLCLFNSYSLGLL